MAQSRDKEMEDFLKGLHGAVEANSFETMCLWLENEKRGDQKLTWVSDRAGLVEGVGTLKKMPVCISLFCTFVDGKKILFWCATSQVVDYRMIDAWMLKNFPPSAIRNDGYPNKVDAMNFYNVL